MISCPPGTFMRISEDHSNIFTGRLPDNLNLKSFSKPTYFPVTNIQNVTAFTVVVFKEYTLTLATMTGLTFLKFCYLH
jgi:hypothetical protein